jgi:hypothetical protein
MKRVALLVAILLAVLAGSCLASTVTLTPSGSGVFVLEGKALQDVSGLDIALSYDPAVLRSPRVDQGGLISGALMMSNTDDPGIIRIAAVRQGPVNGSGTIARITFTAATGQGGDGAISGLSVSTVSSAGSKSQLPTFIGASSQDQGASSATTPSTSEVASPTAATAPPPTVAFVPMVPLVSPAGQQDRSERTNAPADAPAQEASDTAGQVPGTGEAPAVLKESGERQQSPGSAREKRTVLNQKSVLDLFRDFPGPWSVQTTMKLFQQDEMLGSRQFPQVAFSDGATTATLTVIVAAGGKGRPQLTMANGTILSVVKDRESTNAWIVTVRPEKDAVEASLRVDDGVTVRSMPLTVSPRINVDLDGSGTVNEKDFLLYFQSKRNEVRNAGRTNYRVDYIFAANYLFAAGQTKVKHRMTAR